MVSFVFFQTKKYCTVLSEVNACYLQICLSQKFLIQTLIIKGEQ